MHITFLVQRFPGYGGAEEYVNQLATELGIKNFRCTIITSDLDKREPKELGRNVELVRLPVIARIGEYAIWKKLVNRLVRTNTDILHVNTYGYFHSDIAALIRKIKHFRLVFTSHGFHGFEATYFRSIFTQSLSTDIKSRFRFFYDLSFGRLEINSSDALIALSQWDREIYRWMGADLNKVYEIHKALEKCSLKR